MSFILHSRLMADTLPIAKLPLSQLLLMNDARFPWVILVPRRADIREIIDLPLPDQAQLFAEVTQVSHILRREFRPDKLNIGAIGNMVPQLHVHVIARFEADAAWPKPVWGFEKVRPYAPEAAHDMLTRLRAHFMPEIQD
eukprot:gene7025-biopygen4484